MDEIKKLVEKTFKDTLKDVLSSSNTKLKEWSEKLESYNKELLSGEISLDEYKNLIQDLREIADIEELQLEVKGKAALQKVLVGIGNILIAKI